MEHIKVIDKECDQIKSEINALKLEDKKQNIEKEIISDRLQELAASVEKIKERIEILEEAGMQSEGCDRDSEKDPLILETMAQLQSALKEMKEQVS